MRAVPGVGAAAQRSQPTSPTRTSSASRSSWSPTAATGCGSRRRSSRPAGGHPAGRSRVGQGLASALGLQPGTPLVTQFANGGEARFRVVGIVRAFDNDGRIAYVQPGRALCDSAAARRSSSWPTARRGGGRGGARPGGFPTATVGGVTTRNAGFLVAGRTAARRSRSSTAWSACYAVVQMLALTAYERRSTIALIRACGADTAQVAAVLPAPRWWSPPSPRPWRFLPSGRCSARHGRRAGRDLRDHLARRDAARRGRRARRAAGGRCRRVGVGRAAGRARPDRPGAAGGVGVTHAVEQHSVPVAGRPRRARRAVRPGSRGRPAAARCRQPPPGSAFSIHVCSDTPPSAVATG